MVCEAWKTKLDTYLDGEGSEEEMRTLSAHLRSCQSCSAETLARVQMKRGIQVAGRRFTPSAEFRRKIQSSIARKPRPSFNLGWMFATAAAVVLVTGALIPGYLGTRGGSDHILSEIADLHVATLASSSPVDIVSTDRHTVKPWFQGKIPFSFNLPELQGSEFSLLGGRMTYLEQTPGAHLIYDVRKHHVSVFIFQERSLPVRLDHDFLSPNKSPFTTETWTRNGLRYFVIGDASTQYIDNLAKLFKASGS
jgi:anti-sigma factor RsiW